MAPGNRRDEHMCGSMSVFGLPCIVKARHSVAGPFPPSPSRACQGLPWRGATLIALAVQGPPYTARHRNRPLSWGRHPSRVGADRGRGGRKKWKGARKKTRFMTDGHAVCRLLGPLRVPPLAIFVPPTHAEHTLAGGHPTCSACTLGPEGMHVAQGA